MSLQTIINNSVGMTIDRRKVVGLQYTRNELSRASLTPTFNPWRFNIEMDTQLAYSDIRDVLEELDRIDRVYPETISFGNVECLNWIFRYQGQMSPVQISNIRVVSFTNNSLVLGNLPIVPANTVLFQPNDLIQIGSRPHPFTSTTQILRGIGSQVTITTNRPNIFTTSVVDETITVGADCEFKVFCNNMPVYKLFPGSSRYQDGVLINNARIEFSDNFQLYEYLGDV